MSGWYVKDGCTGECFWCFNDKKYGKVCVPCDCPKEIEKIKEILPCDDDDILF